MFVRQIGKLFRGRATPLQVMLAAIIGSMLGFVPGFAQGAGLIVVLTLFVILLNANLVVAGAVGLFAKIVSLFLLPVSFYVGRVLLDGPTQGLFEWMINTPVLALFGLEYYATTGGIVIGFFVGVVCGIFIIKLLTAFRRKMASLESNSERFQKYANKTWVRLLAFIFIGGRHGKRTYAQMMEKKIGNPIRPIGGIFVILLIGLLFIVQIYLSGPILTALLQSGLERANGATVDLEQAEIDLRAGRMTVTGLAMADPNALETDVLRASTVEGDISASDLLRKRMTFDRVVFSDVTSGMTRKVPGKLIGPPPRPSPPPKPEQGEKSIDDYMNDAKKWKTRLAQIRKWLQKILPETDEKPKKESIRDRIKRAIRDNGYAHVKANHLIAESPTLTVTKLLAEGVKTAGFEKEVFDISASNISTHPHLLPNGPQIAIKSRSKNITAIVRMTDAQESKKRNQLRFTYKGLPVDSIASSLGAAGKSPIQGGTMDIDMRGRWTQKGVGYVNLPLNVTLHNSNISIPGSGAQKLTKLSLPLGIRGPIDNPAITLDANVFADALVAAGADALAKEIRGEAGKVLGEATKDFEKKFGTGLGVGLEESADGILDGIFKKSGEKKGKNE